MFKETLDRIKDAADKIDKGQVNNIPFTSFPKLSKYVPGIVKGLYYIVSASSGVK